MTEIPSCACGRSQLDAETYRYVSGDRRFTFHRCECGIEWTDSAIDIDPAEPISAEELITLHERLQQKLPLDELTR